MYPALVQARSLVSKLLQLDADKRCTAGEALEDALPKLQNFTYDSDTAGVRACCVHGLSLQAHLYALHACKLLLQW